MYRKHSFSLDREGRVYQGHGLTDGHATIVAMRGLAYVTILALAALILTGAASYGDTPGQETSTTPPPSSEASRTIQALSARLRREHKRAETWKATAKRNQGRYLKWRRSLGPMLGRFELTSYRDGTRNPGSVAVDTSVIPRGSWLIAEGMGLFQANDVGGAVNGRHLDVYRPEGDNHGNADYGLPGRPRVWLWRGPVPKGFWSAKWTVERPGLMASLPAGAKYPGGRW